MFKNVVFFAAFLICFSAVSYADYRGACATSQEIEMEMGADDLCRCVPTHEIIHPLLAADRLYCKNVTAISKICRDPQYNELNLQIIEGGCFHPGIQDYVSDHFYPPLYPNTYEKTFDSGKMIERIQASRVVSESEKPQTMSSVRARTVQIVNYEAPEKGIFGGARYTLNLLPSEKWWLNIVDVRTSQGGPDWLVPGLGESLGEVLGFSHSSPHAEWVKIPDVTALMAGVQKINERIKNPEDQIIVHFYPVTGVINDRQYLESVRDKFGIPIASVLNGDARLYLHDLDYHVVSSILLPRFILEHFQLQLKYLFEFEHYYQQKEPNAYSTPEMKYVFHKIFNKKAVGFDVGTGQVSLDWSRAARDLSMFRGYRYTTLNETRVGVFTSLFSIFRKEETHPEGEITYSAESFLRSLDASINSYFSSSPDSNRDRLKALLVEFIENKVRTEPGFTQSLHLQTSTADTRRPSVYDLIRKRRSDLNSVAIEIIKELRSQ